MEQEKRKLWSIDNIKSGAQSHKRFWVSMSHMKMIAEIIKTQNILQFCENISALTSHLLPLFPCIAPPLTWRERSVWLACQLIWLSHSANMLTLSPPLSQPKNYLHVYFYLNDKKLA